MEPLSDTERISLSYLVMPSSSRWDPDPSANFWNDSSTEKTVFDAGTVRRTFHTKGFTLLIESYFARTFMRDLIVSDVRRGRDSSFRVSPARSSYTFSFLFVLISS